MICTVDGLLDFLDLRLSLTNALQIEFFLAGSVELSAEEKIERGMCVSVVKMLNRREDLFGRAQTISERFR